jgi:hypothetical protein
LDFFQYEVRKKHFKIQNAQDYLAALGGPQGVAVLEKANGYRHFFLHLKKLLNASIK